MRYSLPKKERRRLTVNQLKQFRLPHEPVYQDIADLALPFRIRLALTDYNRTDNRNTRIYNNTATRALKVFQSGLMTAATDPTSDWFTATIKDQDRADFGPHRVWLDALTDLILSEIADSNIYQRLPVGYGNEAAFGMFALGIEESFGRSAIHSRLYPHGSYWVGNDQYGDVCVFYREYRATVRQLYEFGGPDAVYSRHVQNLMDAGDWEEWVDVAHLIEPNEEYEYGNPHFKRKRYASCWYELGVSSKSVGYESTGSENYVKEEGFDDFPVLVGCWEKTESEVYPTDYPGSECLGDNTSLQIGEKRMWQMTEKMANPHMIAPASMRGLMDPGTLPGRWSWVDERNEGKSVRPLQTVDPAGLTALREQINDVKQRIFESFHYPTFKTFDSLPDKQRTATEILERKSEKLLKLVDMATNNQVGVLRPLIFSVYNILDRRGDVERHIGPPPEGLQGHKLDLRFNGVLAQAQKMNRVQPVQFTANWIAEIARMQGAAGAYPDVMDKFKMDEAAEFVALEMNCPASVIRSDEEAAMVRMQRMQAQQAAQAAQAMPTIGKTAKDLSQADLEGDNALSRLVGKS